MSESFRPDRLTIRRFIGTLAGRDRPLIPRALVQRDCAFLSLVLSLSIISYVSSLGFYSDDWAFLSALTHADGHSLVQLFGSMNADQIMRQRPLQALHLAWLYRLFGTDPLGYHLVNSAVLVVAVLLFYLSLREMRLPRLVALTVPLVYGLLPHYSTDRFWVAAFQATLSMALYFGSLYADLRALRAVRVSRWGWKLASVACLLGSVLAYELALPLFVFNIGLVWLYSRADSDGRSDWKARTSIGAMLAVNVVMLLVTLGFKAVTTLRAGGVTTDYVSHLVHIVNLAARIDYVSLGIGLPLYAVRMARHYADPGLLIAGALLASVVLAYVYRAVNQSDSDPHNAGVWLMVFVLSPFVYVLGYAVFVTTLQFMFHQTGIANRIAIAAEIGVAMTFASGAALASSLLPSAWLRRTVFPTAIALLCLCGFLIINGNARFWIIAYAEQQRVLADIRSNIPSLPTRSTLILDGVCPYIGSGIVFEGEWDLAGALQLVYDDPTLRADVVTPKLRVHEDGITTSMYGTTRRYRYGNDLLLYDFRRKSLQGLTDAETTRRYFDAVKSTNGESCPQGREGEGVTLF